MTTESKTNTGEKSVRGWPPERRTRQAALIRLIRPWRFSTGARTREGKKAVSHNATKHGFYAQHWKTLRLVLNHHIEFTRILRLQLLKEMTIGERRKNTILPVDIQRRGMHLLFDLQRLVDHFRTLHRVMDIA